jgi:phosphatidylglycerol---prolipoprotein diacylglyceryl transferase
MMPVLGWIGDFPIGAWPVFFALASLAGLILFRFLFLYGRPSVSQILFLPQALFLVFYIGGLLGARLLGAIEVGEFSLSSFFSFGQLSFFGGVIGAFVLAMPLLFTWRRFFGRIADAAIPALCLGLAIGRLGCLLNGDDFGALAGSIQSSWWSAPMWTMRSAGPGGELRYATQLEESLFAFGLAGLCGFAVVINRHVLMLRSGVIGFACGVLLCLHRMWNEVFRADFRSVVYWSAYSHAQVLALVLGAVCYLAVAVIVLRKQRKPDRL